MRFTPPRHLIFMLLLALLNPWSGLANAAQPVVRPQAPVLSTPSCAVTRWTETAATVQWLEGCGQVAVQGTPESTARAILAQHAAALGLQPDGSDLQLLGVQTLGQVVYVRLQQHVQGVPVYLGQVVVQYTTAGVVQLINNHTLPHLALSLTPKLSVAQAQQAALAAVTGSDQLRAPVTAQLVIYGEHRTPTLAWQVKVYTEAPLGDWQVLVAAESGQVLAQWNEVWLDTGTGLAYVPNAVQQSGNTGLVDGNDSTTAALDAARVPVTLTNLVNTTFQLKGSYADLTGPGVTGCSLPYNPGQANEPTRVYNYTRADDRFEEVTTYAAINDAQSWFQSLGITNANNRAIPVDVHCISADNSYYSGSDDALHFGDGGVDDAEDADIVLHEYGHAVQDNQVPGWGPSSNTEQRAMGEGFGDFLAGMYYVNQGNATFLNTYKYCIGEWDAVSYNPVVGGNAGSGCLRWIDGRDENDGSNIGMYSGTPSEEHNDGRFWSAALTCVYEGMGANAQARDNIMKIVLAHHFSLTPDSSTQAFERAAAALVLADQNYLGGANRSLIVSCMVGRNLTTAADLSVSQTDAPDPVLLGQAVTYTIAVRNLGASTATSVVLTDTLPASSALRSASITQGACTGSGPVVCNIGSMTNGSLVTATVVVTPQVAGLITNVVTVQSSLLDGNLANSSNANSTTVLASAPSFWRYLPYIWK